MVASPVRETWLHRMLTGLGVMTARPAAFGIVLVYAALWVVLDRKSLDWHGVATLATWLMTLVIQRAEHRDTQAIHAKLDELLRSSDRAEDEMAGIDEAQPETIEAEREKARHGGA
jgi:low affinity Fe/Cu permease